MAEALSGDATQSAVEASAAQRFAGDAMVRRLRALAAGQTGRAQLQAKVLLAWQLRQRDGDQATAIASELSAVLDADNDRDGRLRARLALVDAEVRWLAADLDRAAAAEHAARAGFAAAADARGVSDAHWLSAWIAADRGDLARRDAELQASIAAAEAVGDVLRVELAEAALARSAVFRDLDAAVARWGGRYLGRELDMDPSLAVWVADFCALVASKSQRIGPAVAYGVRMHQAALASGQVQRAITAATNIGFDLSRLNDHDSALEWMQRGLDLARTHRWPASLAVCLSETAETQRQLGRLDAAQELLGEALQALAPLGRSRWRALVHNYLGDVALDRLDHAAALVQFDTLQSLAGALEQADLRSIAARGRAHALGGLGRIDEAMGAASLALELARSQGDAYNRIAALRVLAELHRRRQPAEAALALQRLEEALAIAARIEGYVTPPDLLEEVAREHAARGDFESAYRLGLDAAAARERINSEHATQRAVALQIRQETEAVRAEAEQQRRLAESESRRAAVLEETTRTLARLGEIGQAITSTLSLDAVLALLARQIRDLLAADSFGIYLLEEDGRWMASALLIESGAALPQDRVALDSPNRHVARCARERRELLLERPAPDGDPSQVAGSLATLSALFAPLLSGEHLLGVMTVQSLRPCAYGERDRLIFRSLAAYGAIALDNAAAYRQLEQAHAELGLLGRLSAQLQACPSSEDALAALAVCAEQLFRDSRGALFLAGSASEGWHWAGGWGRGNPPRALEPGDCEALRAGRASWSLISGQRCTHPPSPAAWAEDARACLPMAADGIVFGLLVIEFPGAAPAAADRRFALATALAEQTALALANLRLREALREQSIRDGLTGVYNRRYLDATLARELARAQRSRGALSVAMVDIDHFKTVNDRHGHAAGDRVLRVVAATLQSVFRASDVVCRYGGEEFLVLVCDAQPAQVLERCERLLESLRGLSLQHAGRPIGRLSASVGVACFPRHGESPEALVGAADAALYAAKQGGRDQLRVAD